MIPNFKYDRAEIHLRGFSCFYMAWGGFERVCFKKFLLLNCEEIMNFKKKNFTTLLKCSTLDRKGWVIDF